MSKKISILLACLLHAALAISSTYNLRVEITPNGSGTLNISSGTYEQDASIYLRTYSNTGFVFKGWYENDSLLSSTKNFYYNMPARDAVLQARYEYDPDVPDNPALPDTATYYSFSADILPLGAGTLNIYNGKYVEGANIALRANKNSGYHFIGWRNDKGDTLSTATSYTYIMPQGNAHLTALYYYDPTVPVNPDSMGIKRQVIVKCRPTGSGTFNTTNANVISGNSLQLYSYTNTGYKFLYWEDEKGDTLSVERNFYYTVPDKNSVVYGVFEYDPTTPSNPGKNYWNRELGEVVIDDFKAGSLSSAISQTISGSSSEVKNITVVGSMNNNDYGIANTYTNCTVLDLKRATGVTEIPTYAFDYTNLVIAYLPSTIKSIGANAFLQCSSLEYVTIPETVTSIGNKAFSGCQKLGSIVSGIIAENLFAINDNVFDGVDKSECILYVPKGAIEAYATTSGWSGFKKIVESNSLKQDVDGFYKLATAQDWQEFASFSQINTKACARMTADISIANDTSMIGTTQIPFEGVFDGDGHTLVVAYSSSEANIAPFHHIKNAIIENLRVSGSIVTEHYGVGGIVAMVSGDNETAIRNCWSSAFLASGTSDSVNLIGGFVSNNSGNLFIENCLFDGRISEKNSSQNAGFVATGSNSLTIRNSLNTGTYSCSSASCCGTFYGTNYNDGYIVLDNVYYKHAYGTEQGEPATEEQLADNTVLDYLQNNGSGNTWIQFNGSPAPLLTDGSEFKQIDIEEWRILEKVYEALGSGENWNQPWSLSINDRNTANVPGITLKDGHIVAVDLSGNNITGTFPASILALPKLETIDLSYNNLEGYIDSLILNDASTPISVQGITEINISGNRLKGNAGTFANAFPNLKKLYATKNRIEEVYPRISSNVTDLKLDSQCIERVMSLQLTESAILSFAEQIPTVVSYNHIQQDYNSPINLYIEGKEGWGAKLSYSDGISYGPYTYGQNVYTNEKDDTLTVYVMDAYDSKTGTELLLKILFDVADANFDGYVDVLDLQATILHIFGSYNERTFNYTAANAYADSLVNVQDVVVMVNMLLEKMDSIVVPEQYSGEEEFSNNISTSSAYIYRKGDQIVMRSDVPVAALSIKASGDVKWNLNKYGMIQSTLNSNVVGYYLNKNTLPLNEEIVLGEGRNFVIHSATLSDSYADKVDMDIYNDMPTLIDGVNIYDDADNEVYGISGTKAKGLVKGINIIRNNKGTKKVFKK